MAISTIPFLLNIFLSIKNGKDSGDNPWNALTPEWLTSSPPPVENWEGEAPLVCLLYTSPSPRDLSTSRMPSSA